VLNPTVVNQFGTIKVDVIKTELLFVPTLKTLAPPPPPMAPVDPAVDHFQCYKAKRSKGTPKFQKSLNVSVQDQFGTGTTTTTVTTSTTTTTVMSPSGAFLETARD